MNNKTYPFWVKSKDVTVARVANALNVSESNISTILWSNNKINYSHDYILENEHIDLILSRLAKELEKSYLKNLKHSFKSLNKKVRNKGGKLLLLADESSCKEAIQNDRGFDYNSLCKDDKNKYDKLFSEITGLSYRVAPIDLGDICFAGYENIHESIKHSLHELLYDNNSDSLAGLNLLFEKCGLSIDIPKEANNTFSLLRKLLSRIKIRIKRTVKSVYATFILFYLNFHYYIFNNDDERHLELVFS